MGFRNISARLGLLNTISRGGGIILEILLLLRLLGKVAEDVVEDEVAIRLLGEDECLGKALMGMTLVRDLANYLDDNIGLRTLGIDIGDADFGVLEIEELDALVDSLLLSALATGEWSIAVVPSVLHRR
jgi:hypothetical protein